MTLHTTTQLADEILRTFASSPTDRPPKMADLRRLIESFCTCKGHDSTTHRQIIVRGQTHIVPHAVADHFFAQHQTIKTLQNELSDRILAENTKGR